MPISIWERIVSVGLVSTLFLGQLAVFSNTNGVSFNSGSAKLLQEIRIIDHLGKDHETRRETKIRSSTGRAGKIQYQISRKLHRTGGVRFSKSGVPFVPPLRFDGVTIYPLEYSRKIGQDVIDSAGAKVTVVSFDEEVSICVEGRLIDLLLKKSPKTEAMEATLEIAQQLPTNAALGLTGNYVEEREVSLHDVQPIPRKHLSSLGAERQGFIGTVIVDVEKDSPAQSAGIKARDLIIELAGQRITTPRRIEMIVDFLPLKKKVPCVVVRREGDRLMVLDLMIESK